MYSLASSGCGGPQGARERIAGAAGDGGQWSGREGALCGRSLMIVPRPIEGMIQSRIHCANTPNCLGSGAKDWRCLSI